MHWIIQLLAAAGLLAIIGFIALMILIAAVGGIRDQQPAKVEGSNHEITFTVGNPQDLPGTGLTRMDIAASAARGGPYSSGGSDDTRNILLVERTTGDSRKLLPDNNRRILRSHFLSEKDDRESGEAVVQTVDGTKTPAPISYYLLEIEQPAQPGHETLIVGRLTDRQQAEVMTGIDGVDALWMRSPTQIALIVRDRLKLYYRVIDVPTLKMVQSRPIAIG